MATEMTTSRLLAPFFGASIIVWANIIGLILIFLSLGYWLGGRIADRSPHRETLGNIVGLAAVTIAVVPYAARPILTSTVGKIDAIDTGALIGSFAGTLLLFCIPVTLLGMVPPFAIRLAMEDVQHAGRVAGSLSSLSTVGSIVGTFLSVLVFIPWIGTRRTLFACALCLAVLAAVTLVSRRRWIAVVLACALLVVTIMPTGNVRGAQEKGSKTLYEGESQYQYILVREDEQGRRSLELNEGWAVHSYRVPGSYLTGGIWDHFVVLGALAGVDTPADQSREIRSLIIGNAAGSTARALHHFRPAYKIDGVEIDADVSRMGYEYFDMPRSGLSVHDADGRGYLSAAGDKRWHTVQVDAYRQPYIPFHLTTVEFFRLVSQHLTDEGILAINVGSVPGDNRIRDAIQQTMVEVFPAVFRYRAEAYNDMIIASAGDVSLGEIKRRLLSSEFAEQTLTHDIVSEMAGEIVRVEDNDSVEALTDDHAPVEWMTDAMIVDEAAGGK